MQIDVAKEDRKKPTFASHHGLFQLIHISVGLKNASDQFQHPMDVILFTVLWQLVLEFLDDIVIPLMSPEAIIKQLRHVLLLYDSGITIKLKQFEFFCNTIRYLGCATYPGHLVVSHHTVDATCHLKPPSKITELRSFLSLSNVSHAFCLTFCKMLRRQKECYGKRNRLT